MPAKAADTTGALRPETGGMALLGRALGYVVQAEIAIDDAFTAYTPEYDAKTEALSKLRSDLEQAIMERAPQTLADVMVALLVVANEFNTLTDDELTHERAVGLARKCRRQLYASIGILGAAVGVDPDKIGAGFYLSDVTGSRPQKAEVMGAQGVVH